MTSDRSPANSSHSSRARLVLRVMLAVLFAATVGFAIKAEKPWGRTVQKRIEKKQPLTPKEYAVIGLWWGAVANAALLALLLATQKKWMPRSEVGTLRPASSSRNEAADRLPAVLTFGLLIAAVGVAAWMRAPRLTHSLWNDEEYAMRKFAHGAWEQQKDGSWEFEPATWTETLFENRNGNNHLLNSLITRLALDIWHGLTGSPRDIFSESALRTPAFIAGLLTIVMMFVLGRRIGGPAVGIGAAFILALCPWHVRYAVEAKGYSFMLLFVCTAIWSLLRAVEEDKLRWWLIFALSEAAFILSFAGSVYVALALNVFAAIELAKAGQRARWWTLVAVNLFAALPVIQWTLPSVPQLLAYLKNERSLHLDLGWPFLRDFFSGLAIGFQYNNAGEHAGTSWLQESGAHGWLMPVFMVLAALLLVGLACSLTRSTATRLTITAPVFAVMAAYLQNYLSSSPMVVWYLIYVILPAAFAIPFVISRFTRPTVRLPLIAFLMFLYAITTYAPAVRLRDHARQPMRDAVAFVQQQSGHPITAVLGVSDKQIASYDHEARQIESRSDLQKLVAESLHRNRPFFIYVCGEAEARKRSPEVMAAIDSGFKPEQGHEQGDAVGTFRPVADFLGTEAMFSYRIYHAEKTGITKL